MESRFTQNNLREQRKPRFSLPALLLAALLTPLLTTLLAGLLPAPAARAAEVNVYSYRQPFLIEPLLERFTKETGIKANVVFAPKGLIERLKREGKRSPADLLLTSDIGRLIAAADANVLQKVDSPALRANIPAQYRHSEGLWFGLTVRVRAVFASRERVPQGALSTYEDLADPRWKGRICTRSAQHVYNISLMASMIAHHGEAGASRWAKGLLDNLARKPQGNDRAQVRAIYSGECDIALVNTYYMGKMLEDPKQVPWAESVYIYFPGQNGQGNGAHVNISGGGVTAAAPHRAEAIRLLEFLSSDWAQNAYAAQNHEYPVKPGVEPSPLVKSWGSYRADPLPLETVARQHPQAVRLYDQVGFP